MSIWGVFLGISVIIALAMAAIATSVWLAKKKECRAPRYILFAGFLFAGALAVFPIHWCSSAGGFFGGVKAVLLSLLNGAQIFAAGCEFNNLAQGMDVCDAGLVGFYQAWIVILLVAAPIWTIISAATLLKNLLASAAFFLTRKKCIYVFSHLNEKSLTLAESIYSGEKDPVKIVFAGLRDEQENTASSWFARAKKMKAICFKQDLDVLDLYKKSCEKKLSFFLISENEEENLRLAKEMIPKYKDRANTRMLVFAESVQSELLLSTLTENVSDLVVRRVQESRTLINWLLQNRPQRIFGNAKEMPDGKKHIGVVILGLGSYGTEMLKAMSWYCQMPGYRVTIDAFDIDPLAEDKFTAKAPELMSPMLNGTQTLGETDYTITIHSGVDVTTQSFLDQISRLKNVTYAFVNLGSDSMNVSAGIALWQHLARMNNHANVDLVVYDDSMKDVLTKYQCRGQKFEGLEVVGDLQTTYTDAVILNEDLEQMVIARNLEYTYIGNIVYSINNEYGYYSTAASAIHACAKKFCGIPKDPKNMTEEEELQMMELEHARWNAYMRAEGFIYTGSRDPATRQQIAKTHQDLVPWYMLNDLDKEKDRQMLKADKKG